MSKFAYSPIINLGNRNRYRIDFLNNIVTNNTSKDANFQCSVQIIKLLTFGLILMDVFILVLTLLIKENHLTSFLQEIYWMTIPWNPHKTYFKYTIKNAFPSFWSRRIFTTMKEILRIIFLNILLLLILPIYYQVGLLFQPCLAKKTTSISSIFLIPKPSRAGLGPASSSRPDNSAPRAVSYIISCSSTWSKLVA